MDYDSDATWCGPRRLWSSRLMPNSKERESARTRTIAGGKEGLRWRSASTALAPSHWQRGLQAQGGGAPAASTRAALRSLGSSGSSHRRGRGHYSCSGCPTIDRRRAPALAAPGGGMPPIPPLAMPPGDPPSTKEPPRPPPTSAMDPRRAAWPGRGPAASCCSWLSMYSFRPGHPLWCPGPVHAGEHGK
jgi:hypothetical protein